VSAAGSAYSQPAEMLKRRRTKIVATLGPASSDPASVRELLAAGVDVVRLNFSHGDHEGHAAAYRRVREAAAEAGRPVAVLGDLCGPKIRVGRLAAGQVELRSGETVTVTTRDVVGESALIPSQYAGLAADVSPGSRVLLSDGLMELQVTEVEDGEVRCLVVHGGILRDHKGINLPGTDVSAPALTDKDREDARFALSLGVDYLALSFVRRAEDLAELRAMLPQGSRTKLISKIEKPEAMENIEEIVAASDGIMVARGDLGVELDPESVPIAQLRLLELGRAAAKPTIVATQMLESMVNEAQPTRAEVSDVATAVFSASDAVMLSAETASGAHPVRAVTMMDRIARRAEAHQWAARLGNGPAHPDASPPAGVPLRLAAARATAQLARDLRVRCILVVSAGGATAQIVAAMRPAAPILAVTSEEVTWRQMSLLWGVVPILRDDARPEQLPSLARELTLDLGLGASGQHVLALSGFGDAANPPALTMLEI
jgi:pyruvate kinase